MKQTYTDIAIFMFGTPEYELQDYDLNGKGIRECAADKSAWLATVADAVDTLIGDGWTLKVVKNNIEARHPEVHTCEDAVNRLHRLQIEDVVSDVAEWSAEGERLTPA